MYIDELVQIAADKSGSSDPGYRTWAWYFYPLHDANFNIMAVVDRDGRTIERYEYTPYGQRTVYSHGWHVADATRDGAVDLLDLNDIGGADHWLKNAPKDEEWDDDLNGDGTVDLLDLNLVGAHYGVDRKFTDDPMVSYPTLMSFRGAGGNAQQGEPLCEFGFQGLVHDEEIGLIQNRARVLHPRLGRFVQRDPLGYPDGPNAYAGYHVMWGGLDPQGYYCEAQKEKYYGLVKEYRNYTLKRALVPITKIFGSRFRNVLWNHYWAGDIEYVARIANALAEWRGCLNAAKSGVFKVCLRPVKETDVKSKLANRAGIDHVYIGFGNQYDSSDESDRWGTGFGAHGKGMPPSEEDTFEPSKCSLCKKSNRKIEVNGKTMLASEASDSEIKQCLQSHLSTREYKIAPPNMYTCIQWAKEALEKCGLDCKKPIVVEIID